MSTFFAWLQKEAVMLPQIVAALITLGAAFGFHLTTEQIAALGAIASLIAGLVGRSLVTPNPTVRAEVKAALYTPVPKS